MCAIRIPANDSLEREIAELLTRPVGPSQSQACGVVQGLPLPGRELEDSTMGRGESGVPLWRTVFSRWIHRDQSGDTQPECVALLQQARDGRAVDQGRQAGRQRRCGYLAIAFGRTKCAFG